MRYEQLLAQHERLTDAATHAAEACEDFARNANGHRGHVIPAPTAYELLGNLKVLLWSLNEIADFLPTGLENSLGSADITVLDRDFITGEERDPKASVVAATETLRTMWLALAQAAQSAEQAQEAINSQGYEPTEPARIEGASA